MQKSNVAPIRPESTDTVDPVQHLMRAKSILQALLAASNGGTLDDIDEPSYALAAAIQLVDEAKEAVAS